MVTTNHKLPARLDLSQLSKRNATLFFAITQLKNQWRYLSDLMTKVTHGAKHRKLVGGILYDIYDDHLTQ